MLLSISKKHFKISLYFIICLIFYLFIFIPEIKAWPRYLIEEAEASIEEKEYYQKLFNSLYKKSLSPTEIEEKFGKNAPSTDTIENLNFRIFITYEFGAEFNSTKNLDLFNLYREKLKTIAKQYNRPDALQLSKFLLVKKLMKNSDFASASQELFALINSKETNSSIKILAYYELAYLNGVNNDMKLCNFYFRKGIDLSAEEKNIGLFLKGLMDYGSIPEVDTENIPLFFKKEDLIYSWQKYRYDFVIKNIENTKKYNDALSLYENKEYDKAISSLKKLTEKFHENSNQLSWRENILLVNCYYANEDYELAEEYLLTNLEEYSRNANNSILNEYLTYHIKVADALGKYKLAYNLSKEKIDLIIKSSEKEKQETVAELSKKYEVSLKEEKINQQNVELKVQKRNNLLSILFLLLASALAASLFYSNRKIKILSKKEKQHNKELNELNEFKTNLFAQLSHEFRTPLTLIKSPVIEMLHSRFKGNYKDYYELIIKNTDRLLDLVNQMLLLSRASMGKLTLKKEKNKIGEFIQEIFIPFRPLAKSKKIDFQLFMPEKDVFIDFDKDIIQKILENLISNAIKYTPNNGKVIVTLNYAQNWWSLEIWDNGRGISEGDLNPIFDSFYRSNQKDILQEEGIGLGLAIVKELVDLHNGKINVESTINKNSSFKVIFQNKIQTQEQKTPIQIMFPTSNEINVEIKNRIKPDAAIVSFPTQQAIINQTDMNLPLLMIVEDNIDLQKLLLAQLSEDYRIRSAYDGKDALNKIKNEIPDLILTDIMMPNMNGIEFTKKIKDNLMTSHIPILILTALNDASSELEGLSSGAIDYLTKPIDFIKLKFKLANLSRIQLKTQKKIEKDSSIGLKGKTLNSIDQDFLIKAREIILKNLAQENFTVEHLGEQMSMSRTNLYLKIKALTGRSVILFVRQIKLEKAKEFLTNRQGNITEAAKSVGISNSSHFSKTFKEEYGYSPREFVKKLKEK